MATLIYVATSDTRVDGTDGTRRTLYAGTFVPVLVTGSAAQPVYEVDRNPPFGPPASQGAFDTNLAYGQVPAMIRAGLLVPCVGTPS